MNQDDHSYYSRRLRDEENAARCATSDVARERHEELAAAYRVRLRFERLRDLIPPTFRKEPPPSAGELLSNEVVERLAQVECR